MKIFGAVVISLFFLGCDGSEGDPGPDATPADIDARAPGVIADAGEQGSDAQTHTLCGSGPDAILCEFNLQVCVTAEGGGNPRCVPLPEGCDVDVRDCEFCSDACAGPTDTCQNDEDMNTIVCT